MDVDCRVMLDEYGIPHYIYNGWLLMSPYRRWVEQKTIEVLPRKPLPLIDLMELLKDTEQAESQVMRSVLVSTSYS